ncbi:oxygen-independent coproporphyrinogen III oxidase [Microvirga sp. 17 mud 1-3]|uniref:oxygen-independent coproporphyrinogen III oxidase n=1 Tax=Microvirga sp. 17 mud 1-3 TaxID=2082949 RepID=UPI000D6BE68B|nr:oxygen-independent coproporphyrinogen III oxidase [Microvirga sp. 17 mud 1-3]AWM85397.1 oxygen-independent coproporphyrinogen III oxidase [Microvirga sp. 17 mud 1-3]
MKDDLRARYGEERLPRYTSYPTAPHFSDAIGPSAYTDWLAALPAQASTSLYLHVPFCRSMCWYCGCHTTITQRDAPIVDYIAVLRREIDLVADRLTTRLPVRHIHFGGGTPTIMEPSELLGLMDLMRRRFSLEDTAEVAVEIDPRTLTRTMTATLGEAGVNRASLGVQSFDPVVQRAINRIQSFEQTERAVNGLRDAGVRGINFDLIYGLPHQSVESCIETVRQSIALRPERFSVFGYAHIPSFKKHQRKIDEAALPDGAARYAQAEAIADALTEAGYRRIGLDHYALPGDTMVKAQADGVLHRNFQGYTTDPSDVLIGFGASSIGRLTQGYVQNEVVLGRYAERIGRGELATAKGYALTADDRLRADLIERVMCDFRVDVAEVCGRHGVAADAVLQTVPRLQGLAEDGIVRIDGPVLSVNDDMRFLVRSVASAFDAYLGASGRTHSRAV